jgi:PAS domain S-box-containing protein
VANAIMLDHRDPLHDSEMRFRLLVDSIRDYAIFMLDPQGRVATWNAGAERINGYRADEVLGKHFSIFVPAADVAAGRCEEELSVAAEAGRFETEAWRIRKDGSRFWASVVLTAVRDESGRLVGFAKVTRDLTERRLAEEERAALESATHANRLKDEFLAILGHELRNPLAPIVTALELMRMRGAAPSKELDVIDRQVQHLLRLVDDLLDISRIARGKLLLKKERIELGEVVRRAIEMASPLLEQRRHQVTVEVAGAGLPVNADVVRLAQAVNNLITNAAKYTSEGGHLSIRAHREGEELELAVTDDGVGLSAELLPHVFDLFVQAPRAADRAAGGLGVGLTLVRSLVQLHGGSVSAHSEGLGRGSTFIVRLPAASVPAHAPPPPPLAHPEGPGVRRRVLVVDDNVDAAMLLGEVLESLGHQVRLAHDGPQALATLASFTPDLAILDLGLPVMDGYELAARMRERLGRGCRLVALTGYGQERDRAATRAAGFDEHIVKPIDFDQVRGLVEHDGADGEEALSLPSS